METVNRGTTGTTLTHHVEEGILDCIAEDPPVNTRGLDIRLRSCITKFGMLLTLEEYDVSKKSPGNRSGVPYKISEEETPTSSLIYRLHMNIHYLERPFRCDPCSVSFRTKGHLQKHERSASHHNKLSSSPLLSSSEPQPFKCSDCNIAFRIHGHLAKHLRSKMHIMKLECLAKIPFGLYAELERANSLLTEINTTDGDQCLESLKLPETSIEWCNIAEEFNERWQFPNCLGAIDGKHIVIESPINSGTEFYNYKGTFSVLLMALVNANYEFIFVNIGCQGRISDRGVFRNTSFLKKLENNQLLLPEDKPLHNNEKPLPYVFLGDDAFPLSSHLMKPYAGVHDKDNEKRIFNYRLSRARRVVENVFGIFASVFRVFRKPMLLQPDKVTEITMACVLLHNFLRKSRTSRSNYMPPELVDSETDRNFMSGSWRKNNENMTSFLPMRQVARKPGQEALVVRNSYAQYFVTNEAVPWQNNY